jgi:hypothetical protein
MGVRLFESPMCRMICHGLDGGGVSDESVETLVVERCRLPQRHDVGGASRELRRDTL